MSERTPVASVQEDDEAVSVYAESPEQKVKDRRQLDAVRERAGDVVRGLDEWLVGVADEKESRGSSGSRGSDDGLAATTAVGYAVSGLQEMAKRVQRLSKMQFAARYRKGRVVNGAMRRGEASRMKQYSLTGSRTLLDLERADGIYDELNSEKRVTCQITARTAIGKTTRFPSMLATRCKRRVLLVEPDVSLSKYAAEAQKGVVKVRTPWMKSRMPVLTTMSYDDFNGHFRGQNGLSMLDQFDVVVFDEAHVKDCRTESAKTIAATYSKTASLLVCSATIDGEDVQATGKPVKIDYTTTTLRTMADNGKLMTCAWGKDRTLVMATDDQEAQYVSNRIAEGGYDVCVLDSASRDDDIAKASAFLEGDNAVVNRFLVVTPRYGLGYNFRTGNLITSGRKVVHVMTDGGRTCESRVVPCSRTEIKQQIGRVNRGMTESATALVCVSADEIVEESSLTSSEKLRYYVTMVASHIVPTRELREAVGKLLPFGLTQQIAADLLAINLPIEVAIRYFADDGRIPPKYVDAISAFSEEEYEFMVSDYDEPHGRDSWVAEPMSGYYDEVVESLPAIEVPCHASGSIKVMLHAVSAASKGLMTVDQWGLRYQDSDVSDDGIKPQPARAGAYMPRLVLEAPPVRAYKALPLPYSYNVPGEQQYAPRSRLALHADTMPTQMVRDLAAWDVDVNRSDFSVSCEVQSYREGGAERIGIVNRAAETTPVDVHSPGGSIVMAFRKVVWQQLVAGEALSPEDARSFFHSIKNNVEGFVESDAFSGWTDVWKAIFRTAGNSNNIKLVKDYNYTTRVITLVMALVLRYTRAIQDVSRSSMIKADFLSRMLGTRESYEELYRRQSSRGRAEIVQSEAFLRRVFEIRDVMVDALMSMEAGGIFAPMMVTQLQQVLPVMRATGVRLIDKPSSSRLDRFLRPGGTGK